jgi:hypothetical protein
MATDTRDDAEELLRATLRLNSKLLGFVIGLLSGLVVFVATIWLVLAGGHVDEHGQTVIGPHLQLLGQFFIGYRVSFLGSLIGFAYGFAVGSITGSLIAAIYNRVADRLG